MGLSQARDMGVSDSVSLFMCQKTDAGFNENIKNVVCSILASSSSLQQKVAQFIFH